MSMVKYSLSDNGSYISINNIKCLAAWIEMYISLFNLPVVYGVLAVAAVVAGSHCVTSPAHAEWYTAAGRAARHQPPTAPATGPHCSLLCH